MLSVFRKCVCNLAIHVTVASSIGEYMYTREVKRDLRVRLPNRCHLGMKSKPEYEIRLEGEHSRTVSFIEMDRSDDFVHI